MDSKEIKASLKEAREAIKNKDYSTSLKICKNILKSDRENYMALVFLGISLQETGPKDSDQVVHAFRKALAVNSAQPLAWHGLMNYYEKENPKAVELLEVYGKLLEIETDSTKFSDLCSKLVNFSVETQEIAKSSEVLFNLMKDDDQNSRTACLALASLFIRVPNLQPEQLDLYEKTLKMIIKESTSVTCDYYKEYLKLLYKLKKFKEVFVEAKNMYENYENSYALEWICKIYVELVIEEDDLSKEFENEIVKYLKKLTEMQPDCIMGIFTQAVIAFRKNDYATARDYALQVVEVRRGMTHAWVLLSECLLKIHVYDEALSTVLQVGSNQGRLRKKIDKIMIQTMSRSENEQKWRDAVELGSNIDIDDDVLESLFYANLNLRYYEECSKLIKKLPEKSSLLKAVLLKTQGRSNEALELLFGTENFEICLEIGKIYWEQMEYEKCLVPFLKAAKFDQNSFEAFVYLGRYYEHVDDMDKARRCYQKANKINPRCSAAGIGLSNIYRKQKNWDANLALLHSCTRKDNLLTNSHARWAWLQLGLHYLERAEYTNAIDCFRSVIRVEPDNSHYWECLADAYMARGSYTSAMKSYERSAELTQDNLYSKLQIASIKLLIGHFPEAKAGFEEILFDNKKYVPALKGLADTCLNIAYNCHKQQLIGLCQSNVQLAVDYLTTALRERGDFSCLWKLFADCCHLVANLPEKYSCMIVHTDLSEDKLKNDYDILDSNKLFTLATRGYCKAIGLTPNNLTLWYDLAVSYYSHATHLNNFHETYPLLEQSLTIIKYCIQNSPTSSNFWNLIGVISVHRAMKNYSIAQHAFITAINFDKNNAMAWCNLGALYHLLEDIPLANKCYSQAQRSDPLYANSWIGQAIIAETMGHDDAMDLFRHSNQLNYHSESALNYASWVCRTILESTKNVNMYCIKNMHAIPVAWDAMVWYTENNPNDTSAWNMLGILSERLGLNTTAEKAFKTSLSLCSDERDKILINFGRMLTKKGEYEGAIDIFKNIKEASFRGGCGLALALFKAKQFEASYDSYDSTMQWLAENENKQSHVLVALAAMAYMFQGPKSAKPLLFRSTQMKPPSTWGLFATLSLGLLHGEINLAQLVLKELVSIRDEQDVIYHNAILETYIHLVQGNKKKSVRCLTKYIHRHPGKASLWLSFAMLLIQANFKLFSKTAANCAEVAMHLGRSEMDVTKVWSISAFASLLSLDFDKSIKAAQKAIYYYPNMSEGWALLISALGLSKNMEERWSGKKKWVVSQLNFLKMNQGNSQELQVWLARISM